MTIEEELRSLREEKAILQEQVASRDAIIQQQQGGFCITPRNGALGWDTFA